MRDPASAEGQIVSDRQAIRDGKTEVELWLEKISAAKLEEKDWRESAQKAVSVYEAGKDQNSAFNIYHANVETIVPALYNSTPIPDVRRRYDPEPIDPSEFAGLPPEQAEAAMQQAQQQMDAIGKAHRAVAELTERGLSYSVDGYDFDDVIEDAVRDAAVTGRGVVRLRYLPEVEQTQDGPKLIGEDLRCELVPWNRFIRGPGIAWKDVPFVAFDHDLTQEQVEAKIDDKARLKDIGFTAPREDGTEFGAEREKEMKHKGILKTIKVYEVWDKPSRTVLFLSPQAKDRPLWSFKAEAVPGWAEFFPTPKPLQLTRRLASQVPICPYDVYAPLIDEIDRISRRITALIKQLVVKGGYDPKLAPEFESLRDADDGTYIPISASEEFVQGNSGGLEKAVLHWPVEQIIKVIAALYEQREAVKQTIYEVMGISDILRGQVDPREKLGQSQIKEASGSRRLQRSQTEVARLARDLFRMKAEIIHKRFAPETIGQMTGMRVTDQVLQIMRSEARSYSIDIETDSTVRADMAKYQEELNQFLQGTSQFGQSLAALAPVKPDMIGPLTEVYAEFAGKFNLGKRGEKALDGLIDAGKQPPVQPDDGAAEAAKREAEMRAQEMQAQSLREQQKHDADMQLKGMDQQLKQQDMEHRRELAGIEREGKLLDFEMKQAEFGMKREAMAGDMAMREREMELAAEGQARDLDHKGRLAEIKEKQASKPKPQNGASP